MTSYTKQFRMNYTPEQVFDLVADVEHYPEFLPWIAKTRLRPSKGQSVSVDMTIGSTILQKPVSVVATLDRPHKIDIRSDDPIFERFQQWWTFEQAAEDWTTVECHIEVRFRSLLLQAIVELAAGSSLLLVSAFKRRARKVYGAPNRTH